MELAVETSALHGSPWGGVGILLKNTFSRYVHFHKFSDRYTIVVLDKTILICVYLQTTCNQTERDIVVVTLSKIETIICDFPFMLLFVEMI